MLKFIKRARSSPVKLPDLYTDVWRAVIHCLEWPEMMGMRLVCKEFSKLLELSIAQICVKIRADIEPLILEKPVGGYSIVIYLRSLTLYNWNINQHDVESVDNNHYVIMREFPNITPSPVFKGTMILYNLKIIFTSCSRDFNAGNAFEIARHTGHTRFIRAARISGYLDIPRPKNWESFFSITQ